MKKTITQWLYMDYGYSADFRRMEWAPAVRHFKYAGDKTSIFIGPVDVDVEIPDNFDPVPGQVKALEAEKAEALAKYQKSVADINDQLSKLQAIGREVEA